MTAQKRTDQASPRSSIATTAVTTTQATTETVEEENPGRGRA